MKPYYEHAGITIYHGDCRDVLPHVTADALVTDPPYGVSLGACGDPRGGSHGMRHDGYASFSDTYENFVSEIVPRLNAAIDAVKRAAVFTGPHIHEQRKPDAIGGVFVAAGQGRTAWGFKSIMPILLYGGSPTVMRGMGATCPTAIASGATADDNGHPCPKPLTWMRWLVRLATVQDETVLDVFAGSGTTLRAAKDLGRRAIGIEIEERYCEIAAKRLSQEVLQFEAAHEMPLHAAPPGAGELPDE